MTAKKTVVTALVVVLAAVLGSLVLFPSHGPDAPPAGNGDGMTPPPAVAGQGKTPPLEAYPPPIDLDAADRDLDLHGRVVDAQKRPVAGARVETIRWPWRRSSVLNHDGYDRAEPGPEARTGTDGSFRLRLRRGELVDLRVTAEGFADTTIPRCQAGERLLVVLTAGTEAEIRCRDEAGTPVSNVRVRLRGSRGTTSPVLHRDGKTDGSGRLVFTGVTAGRGYLQFDHPELGNPGARICTIPATGRLTVEVTMPAGRALTGEVTDAETGEPIPGARVGAGWILDRAVETDEEGRYILPGWTDALKGELHVTAEGYGRRKQRVDTLETVDFKLSHGDVAVGRIVGRDGAPVVGALVSALAYVVGASITLDPDAELDTVSGTTAADGRFRLPGLRRDLGRHTLVVQATGHAKLLRDFDRRPEGPGEIDLGEIVLGSARRLEGVVVFEDSRPGVEATVQIRRKEEFAIPNRYGGRESRRTDDLGRFRFPDLAPGRYFLTLEQAGYPRITQDVVIPEDEDVLDLEIRRTGGRKVTVLAVGPGGKPIAGAFIASRTVGLVLKGRTGADGRVVLEEVPARTVRIYIHNPAPDVLPLPAVTIHPGETEITVRFEAASFVRGVVLDPDGNPLPKMLVVARTRERSRLASGDTDAEGSFRLKLRKGTVADLFVTGQRAGGGMSFAAVHGRVRGLTAPADGIVIRTERVEGGRSLTVLVLDTRGRPLAGAEVSVSAQGRFQYKPSGPDGLVSFTDLPGAEASVWVQMPESSNLPENAVNPKQAVVVPNGQVVEMRFRVGQLLTGIVRGPDGEPFPGAILSVMSLEGVSQNLTSGKDGRFRCPAALGVDHYVRAGGQDAEGNPLNGFAERIRPERGEIEIRLAGPPR